MEVINVYPEYDGKGYEEDIHKYTFPHRKVYDAELDRQKESEAEELDTEDFLIWGTDYKDQFF